MFTFGNILRPGNTSLVDWLFRNATRYTPRVNQSQPLQVELLEPRQLLSAVFPAFVDGVFSFGDPQLSAPYGLQSTFRLASNPTATKTIYLDYTGHHSVNNTWGHDIVFPAFDRDGSPSSFSNSELIEIQRNFQNVAEDWLPFDVNVTTIEPSLGDLVNSGGGDQRWGIRALQTQATDGFGNGIGGVAYIGSFDWGSDTPAFTFNKGANNGAMTISHEVGHAVGLRHDGLNGQTYHPGTGTGETSWGPIMGAPFGRNLTQWSDGDYNNSTNTEDDLAIITTQNGFGYRADDHGSTQALASLLTVETPTDVSGWGIVERNTDVDFWRFETGAGPVDFSIEPFGENPNLDVLARLYDAGGGLLGEFNPVTDTNGSFSINLAEGTYFLSIEGTGLTGEYSDYGSLGFYTIVGTVVPPSMDAAFAVGETGTVNITRPWTTVNLARTYTDPIVVVGPGGFNESDPMTVRVSSVAADSFDVRVEEWTYLDREHVAETVGYLVVEAGTHQLEGGTQLIAGRSDVTHRSLDVQFDSAFANVPVVFAQVSSRNGGQPVVTRIDQVTETGFRIRLQEEQAADGKHGTESVTWVALEPRAGQLGGLDFEAVLTPTIVDHRGSSFGFTSAFAESPVLLGNIQTEEGKDVANLRYTSLDAGGVTVFVEEEQSADPEITHNPEAVGYLAIESGLIMSRSTIGETGSIASLTHQWQTVFFDQVYQNPVVIVSPPSTVDLDPTTIRVSNVTSSSFDVKVQDWNYLNRSHLGESVDYLVVEAGTHRLADGTLLVADSSQVNHNASRTDFSCGFDDVPVLLTQLSSETGRATVAPRIQTVDASGFEVRLVEEEAADGTHSYETVSWVAIEVGGGENGDKNYEVLLAESAVDHNGVTLSLAGFSSRPTVFSDLQSVADSDPATLRYTSVASTSVSMFVQEEQSLDDEVSHGLESVGILALEDGRISGFTVDVYDDGSSGNSPWLFSSGITQLPVAVPRVTFLPDQLDFQEIFLPLGHVDFDLADDHLRLAWQPALNNMAWHDMFLSRLTTDPTPQPAREAQVASSQVSARSNVQPDDPFLQHDTFLYQEESPQSLGQNGAKRVSGRLHKPSNSTGQLAETEHGAELSHVHLDVADSLLELPGLVFEPDSERI